MRKSLALAMCLIALGTPGFHCNGAYPRHMDGSTGGGATTSTTDSTTTSSTSTSSSTSSSSSGAGGGPDCTGTLGDNPSDCGLCLEAKCCTELQACTADTTCNDCLMGSSPDSSLCDMDEEIAALRSCLIPSCMSACTPPRCARFCCNDADCGSGKCNKTINGEPKVGVCVDATNLAACDAPATSPSGGSCGAGFPCNPVTNQGCNAAAGEACDFNGMGGYQCYGGDNVAFLCNDCDNTFGPHCQPGLTCLQAP